MTNGQFSCIIFHQNFIIETNFCLHICIYTGIYVFCVSVGMKANTGDLYLFMLYLLKHDCRNF